MVAGNLSDQCGGVKFETGQSRTAPGVLIIQAILEETGYHLDAMNDKLTKEAEEENISGQDCPLIGERSICQKFFGKPR